MTTENFFARGLQKLSLIDFSPHPAAVIFTGGCNFRCPYCHNPDLVLRPDQLQKFSDTELLEFLKKRKPWLDGVVITGGEPTIAPGLVEFITSVKELGYLVKLDTNGTKPMVIKELLDKKLLDFISMDIKAPILKYTDVVMAAVSFDKIKKSIELVFNSGIDYEFRTTVVPRNLDKEDILKIAKMLSGSRKFAIQQFRPENCLDKSYNQEKSYSKEELEEFAALVRDDFDTVEVRTG